MKNTSIGFRLTEQEKTQLTQLAQTREISISQIIREAIEAYLKEDQTNDN